MPRLYGAADAGRLGAWREGVGACLTSLIAQHCPTRARPLDERELFLAATTSSPAMDTRAGVVDLAPSPPPSEPDPGPVPRANGFAPNTTSHGEPPLVAVIGHAGWISLRLSSSRPTRVSGRTGLRPRRSARGLLAVARFAHAFAQSDVALFRRFASGVVSRRRDRRMRESATETRRRRARTTASSAAPLQPAAHARLHPGAQNDTSKPGGDTMEAGDASGQ